jgi:hypothetical protein
MSCSVSTRRPALAPADVFVDGCTVHGKDPEEPDIDGLALLPCAAVSLVPALELSARRLMPPLMMPPATSPDRRALATVCLKVRASSVAECPIHCPSGQAHTPICRHFRDRGERI